MIVIRDYRYLIYGTRSVATIPKSYKLSEYIIVG